MNAECRMPNAEWGEGRATPPDDASKNGVAIIIVVGMLGMLLLMAVAFSISMRIERRGAGAHRFSIQALHMARAALSEAMFQIDTNLDNSSDFFVYPPWDVTSSGGEELAQVLTSESVGFIPGSLFSQVGSATPQWNSLKVASASGEDVTRGRMAFVAVNTSGLLDGNVIGGTNRLYGHSAAEIPAGLHRDIDDYIEFINYRGAHTRYETLPEMTTLNRGLAAFTQPPTPEYPPFDLAVYSRAEEGQYLNLATGTGSNKVDLSGTDIDLIARRSSIEQGLVRSGILGSSADFVFWNLIDYVDTNSVPYDLGGPYTEAVPMLSELQGDYRITTISTGAAQVARASVGVHVELHYPFTRPSDNQFSVVTECMATLRNQNTGARGAVTGGVVAVDSGYSPGVDAEKFLAKNFANYVTVDVPAENGEAVVLDIGVRAWVIIPEAGGGTNGTMVDAAPYPLTDFIMLPTVTKTVLGGMIPGKTGKEVCDPRFNWRSDDINYWRASTPADGTLGTTNGHTVIHMMFAAPLVDKGLDMYVSDAGRLNMVGELGNLLLGNDTASRLRTIRLTERPPQAPLQPVLKYFTLTNGTMRGMVNLNATNTNVLEAVFLEAPSRFGSTQVISRAEARLIAQAVKDVPEEFFDVADIGYRHSPYTGAGIDWDALLPGRTDHQRESIISHTAGLLTVRQNLFTIFVSADSFSESIGASRGGPGTVLSSTRAVAEVWRDPFRDENGNHRMQVRYFRIIEN